MAADRHSPRARSVTRGSTLPENANEDRFVVDVRADAEQQPKRTKSRDSRARRTRRSRRGKVAFGREQSNYIVVRRDVRRDLREGLISAFDLSGDIIRIEPHSVRGLKIFDSSMATPWRKVADDLWDATDQVRRELKDEGVDVSATINDPQSGEHYEIRIGKPRVIEFDMKSFEARFPQYIEIERPRDDD
jgi:hypothetical protein